MGRVVEVKALRSLPTDRAVNDARFPVGDSRMGSDGRSPSGRGYQSLKARILAILEHRIVRRSERESTTDVKRLS